MNSAAQADQYTLRFSQYLLGATLLLAPLFYSTLVYAAVFAWLAFGEIPVSWTWAGSALIIASGLWLARGGRAESGPAPKRTGSNDNA